MHTIRDFNQFPGNGRRIACCAPPIVLFGILKDGSRIDFCCRQLCCKPLAQNQFCSLSIAVTMTFDYLAADDVGPYFLEKTK